MEESAAKIQPLYIVTGATDNMGSAIARKLALQGKAVLLACRDEAKAINYAAQLRNETRNQDVGVLQLDLSSFEQVQDFVERLKQLTRPVAALVTNAGPLPRHERVAAVCVTALRVSGRFALHANWRLCPEQVGSHLVLHLHEHHHEDAAHSCELCQSRHHQHQRDGIAPLVGPGCRLHCQPAARPRKWRGAYITRTGEQ